MIPITMEDLEELNEGMFLDNVTYLKAAYGQVQYVFDELGSGFKPLTAARINVLIGRLNCAAAELKQAKENLEICDDVLKDMGARE